MLKALRDGFGSADVVITTGGMSMGQRDLIKNVLVQDLGVKIQFGRLAMKPGFVGLFVDFKYFFF